MALQIIIVEKNSWLASVTCFIEVECATTPTHDRAVPSARHITLGRYSIMSARGGSVSTPTFFAPLYTSKLVSFIGASFSASLWSVVVVITVCMEG